MVTVIKTEDLEDEYPGSSKPMKEPKKKAATKVTKGTKETKKPEKK